MAEPQSKTELLELIASEHKQLEQTLDRIPTTQLVEPALDGGWAVKDVLAHITWWERYMVQLIQGALKGHPQPPMAALTEDWEAELDRINLQVFNENRERTVDEIIAERQSSYGQVIAMIGALPDDILTNPAEVEAMLGRQLVRLIGGNTYEHYREHNDLIVAWLDGTVPTPAATDQS